jgi:hypothetical protein
MKLIESKTLATAAASIEFTSIPSTFTDLVVLLSTRVTDTSDAKGSYYTISFNSNILNYSARYLQGNGSSAASGPLPGLAGIAASNAATANTFGNDLMYVPNYTASTNKSYSVDSVSENNATGAYQTIVAGLWADSSAITTVKFTPSSGNFMAGCIVSLYGVLKGSDGIVTTS